MYNNQQKTFNSQSLFDNSRDGIYRSTPEGEYIDVNPALLKMLGYEDKEELLRLNIPKKVYYNGTKRPGPRDREDIFTSQLKKKNGDLIWAEISSWVVRDEKNNILYYEGIVRDITQRKRYLKILHDTKKQLQITLESIGDGVIVTDIKGNVKMVNECTEKLTGYTQKELEGRPLTDVFNIINEYSRKKVKNPVEKVIKSGKVEGLANHTILISKDGQEKAISDSAAPIKDKNGHITGIVMVFRDVSERSEMIKQLKRNEEKYRNLFENTGTAMAILGEDTSISTINNEMLELTGYSKDELEGEYIWSKLVTNSKDFIRMKEFHKYIQKNKNKNKSTEGEMEWTESSCYKEHYRCVLVSCSYLSLRSVWGLEKRPNIMELVYHCELSLIPTMT